MKILITGGCGFVGSNLSTFLKKKIKNSKIASIDNLSRKGSEINAKRLKKLRIINYKIDINNYNKIAKLKKFDLVIDCCAEPAIEESIKNPDKVFNTNLVGTFNILKKCIKDKAKLIFLSTSRVYSIPDLKKLVKKKNICKKLKLNKTIKENFSTNSPISLYGLSKLASEKLIKEFSYMHNIKYLINRFGVISGPWQFGKQDQGFVSLWVSRYLKRIKLKYIGFGGNGQQVRDIIHIDDVCEIILKQIRKFSQISNEIFNIGGGKKNSISLIKLSSLCEQMINYKNKIDKIKKESIFDIPYYVTDNSKIYKFYSWKPKKSIQKILVDIKNWLTVEKKILQKYF